MTEQNLDFYRMKAEVCKTLADPKRLFIINELRSGEKSVGELAKACGLNQAVVSRHLAVMRNSGVVAARREGTNVIYSLTDSRIGEACDIMQQVVLAQIEKTRKFAEGFAFPGRMDT